MLAAGWLVALCAMILAAVALPLPARIAICIGVATSGVVGIRSNFLLAGRNAVRAIAWPEEPRLLAYFGPLRTAREVCLGAGSFRLGHLGLILWFKTSDGTRSVFIDAGKQEAWAIRRLCRRLNRAPSPQAGTIQSQGLKCVTRH